MFQMWAILFKLLSHILMIVTNFLVRVYTARDSKPILALGCTHIGPRVHQYQPAVETWHNTKCRKC